VGESEVIDTSSKKAYFPKSKYKLPESASKVLGLYKIGEDAEDHEHDGEDFDAESKSAVSVVKILVVYLDKKSQVCLAYIDCIFKKDALEVGSSTSLDLDQRKESIKSIGGSEPRS
jgi:hypothetical protein